MWQVSQTRTCSSFRFSFPEKSKDKIFIKKPSFGICISDVFATRPVSADEENSALGLVVNFDEVNVVSGVQICQELNASVILVDGLTDTRDNEDLVAFSMTGGVYGRGVMLVGVAGHSLGLGGLNFSWFRIPCFLSYIIVLCDSIILFLYLRSRVKLSKMTWDLTS